MHTCKPHITSRSLRVGPTSLARARRIIAPFSQQARSESQAGQVSSLGKGFRRNSPPVCLQTSSSKGLNRGKTVSKPPTTNRASYSTKVVPHEEPAIHDIFESKTGTWQYVVADPATSTAIIIDPVLDYDAATATISTRTADALLSMIKDKNYKVDMILETHAHADHITAASYLQSRLAETQSRRPLIGIGIRIVQVQKLFSGRYQVPAREYEGVFDKLLEDDEEIKFGELTVAAMHLPGHTPDHMGYKIGDNIFTGDSIFAADLGSARADFPGGSAEMLFHSGRKLLGFPDHVRIWAGHDYPPEERTAPRACMTVGEHRKHNKHLKDGITKEEFVVLRKNRDEVLAEPKLLHQSLQMNIRAGRLPTRGAWGDRLLQIPLKPKNLEW